MRWIGAIILVAVFVATARTKKIDLPDDVETEYKNFKIKYKKANKNKVEDLKRKLEFCKTWSLVKTNNELFDQGLVDYSLEVNQFGDLPFNERLSFSTGNLVPENENLLLGRTVEVVTTTTYPPGPPAIDWTTSNCIGPVKDQGYFCNNCWAFSTVAALEAQWCLKKGAPTVLSEQQLVDCNRNNETGNWGCDGGNQASAYAYIEGNGGIQNLTTYPYEEDKEHSSPYSCRFNANHTVASNSGYLRIRPYNETLLRDCIAANGYDRNFSSQASSIYRR
jgi:C1A family cysteine protease